MITSLCKNARNYYYKLIAAEISSFSRYYDKLVQTQPLAHDCGELFELIDCPIKLQHQLEDATQTDETATFQRTIFLINGNLNYEADLVATLSNLESRMARFSRLVVVAYNPYLRWLYQLLNWLGIRSAPTPTTFLTHVSLANIARLSGLEVVRSRDTVLLPFSLFGMGDLVNRLFTKLPLFRSLSLATVITLRSKNSRLITPSVAIVIPARNERGNMHELLSRIPQIGPKQVEVLLVEGHSSDGTWEEIEKIEPQFNTKFKLRKFKQSGQGKNDAVRLGFAQCEADLLMILDADLSVIPEDLTKFYSAWCESHADFINGNRLTYPMQRNAMRFLNRLGNIFFAKALSAVLESELGDTLCGTKVVLRSDYQRMRRWRIDFGDFDPFGDFELLFPAAVLSLAIVDVPIAYHQRLYGQTNIQRFRHGLMLLRMTILGLVRIRFGPDR